MFWFGNLLDFLLQKTVKFILKAFYYQLEIELDSFFKFY